MSNVPRRDGLQAPKGQFINVPRHPPADFRGVSAPNADTLYSIAMYEIDNGWWFVPNALNRFTVSPRNDLVANADGSITLYFQNEPPGKDKEANWLPAPRGAFLPMLRMYWPQEASPSIRDGTWSPQAVMKAS